MSITTTVPLPEVRAVVTDMTVELNVLGNPETLTASTSAELRTKIMSRVVKLASGLGTDVRLEVHDHTGRWRLVASPDGHLREDEPLPSAEEETVPVSQKIQPPSLPAEQLSAHLSEPAAAAAAAAAVSSLHDAPTAEASETAEDSGEELPTRKAARASFIIDERREPAATNGWRGLLARTTGLQVPASVLERERRRHVQAVSQHWPGPRKISVVNGKGGVGKTLTTAMLTAVFARHGGAGVLAWDNNDTRGTLGWRTEKGPHDATVQDLLPDTVRLLSPSAQISDLARFVHHQTSDKYDVLRSNPELLATKQRITQDDFDALHEVAAKYFRLVFFDSGNDESAPRWLRMIDHTDQLVVATTALGESAESGALLLEALSERDEHSAALARNAVVVVLQSERNSTIADAKRVADGFTGLARMAVTIPFDRALHGGALRYDAVRPATRAAWLRAGAAVADGL
jgi:MinD-like ATPase involved in chromosome partitioning or flagellar assembly